MADQIRATPRSPLFGLFSDIVNVPLDYMSSPERTQQMQGVASFIRSTGVPSTLERLSYDPSGRGLFTGAGGLGGTTRMRPEAMEALMTVAPMIGPAARMTKGLPVGMSIKDVGRLQPPQAEALRLAQQRAALPVSQGGLGLVDDNTALERAQAMGFEFGWAHGSPRNDIVELQPSKFGAEGPGAYATNYLPEASTYSQTREGATIYPLMVRRSEALDVKRNNPYEELGVREDDALLSALANMGKSAIIRTQEKTPQWLIDSGSMNMPERQHFVSVRPENFRSRFAAFDPFRRNAAIAAAMGVAAPNLLANEVNSVPANPMYVDPFGYSIR